MRIRDATVDDLPAIVQLLADEDGVLVGTLQLSFLPHLTFRGGWRAQVEAVRTANDRRGEGLGSQLLRWAIAAADERGCHLIQLTTNATRPDAQRFYAELGFEATHQA